ncbi:MAG: reverse transcriptase domain-containing protein, partial [Candidatus Tectomicrobia bacterium]|nr:reverse transcriptase domain-containing protein [Candidatus Tectomicrobia bacterium]
MTAGATPAGAVSHDEVDWHARNWQKAHTLVRRLQARIVKATQAGRWGKVRALQRLLTPSFAAKVVAVKRVTGNHGKRTPGVEGVMWETPEKNAQAVSTLRQRGYRTQPLRRGRVAKSGGTGKRPLSIPCMHDRAMQALYLLALDPIAETLAAPNSYGFRLERPTADAIDQCHRVWSQRGSAPSVLEGDIRSCFDSLSHDWLIAHSPMDKGILRKWLQAGFLDKHVLYPTEAGVPQGGVASPVMMNLALNGLERHIKGAFPTYQGHTRTKVHVIRCADDFIVTGRSRAFLADEVRPLAEQSLAARGLALSRKKTRVTHIEDGFDLLGAQVRKYRGKRFCPPAEENVQAFLDTIRGIVKRRKQAITGNLIRQLNPVIRGWAPYHQHGASKRTFAQVDPHIVTLLGQWARRRHPQQSRQWIRDQDFRAEAGNHWVFCGHITRATGTPQDVRLFRASSVPIRRHTKITGEANPYDPPWEPYFEARWGVRIA